MAGYHLADIPKAKYGTFEKIKEELLEAEDAIQQDCRIMELVELSDLIGAIEGYVVQKYPGMGLDDLITMAAITKRAFRNGGRT